MKIAIISEDASPITPGGGDRGDGVCVSHLAHHLGRLGHSVDIFTRRTRDDVPPAMEMAPGVRVLHIPAGPARALDEDAAMACGAEFTECVMQFFAHAKRNGTGYSLAHAYSFRSGPTALEAKKALGTPMVASLHSLARAMPRGSRSQEARERRVAAEDAMVEQAELIVVECDEDREDLIRLYHGDPERIAVVPWGFDSREFFPLERAVARAALSWDADAFSILQFGRPRPWAGIDNAIRGLGIMRRLYGSRARLYVVDGGTEVNQDARCSDGDRAALMHKQRAALEVSRLRGVAEGESVSDLVTFLGAHNRELLHVFYGAADVFVSMPWQEPSGLTTVEAMACARPVIGARLGGVAAAIQDGVTGYVVHPRDPYRLAEKLRELMRDPQRAAAMGAAGRARAINSYTWEAAADKLQSLYRPVVASRSRILRPKLRLIQGRRAAPVFNAPMARTILPVSARALHGNVKLQRAVFLDKDATLLCGLGSDVRPEVRPASAPMLMRFAPDIRAALRRLGALEVRLIVLDSRSAEGQRSFAERAMSTMAQRLKRMFAECGAIMSGFYYCPHEPAHHGAACARACGCGKPKPGLLLRAATEHNLDIARSWLVCASTEDIEAGRRAGCGTIFLDNDATAAGFTAGPTFVPAASVPAAYVPDYAVPDLDAAARLIDCFQPALGK